MGITLLLLVFVLMIAFLATAMVIYNLQKNNKDSADEFQSHILQEFHKTQKPPK
ncbi:hypothetical protein [Psychrobacillus sp. OK028]|uniref:hypothetical protein n=1 Tax=Psychrobacillus sp. OK028 TaxID=1884359 RepID=UPI001587A079|nr:hypothetical protein [Psychrobacillus sp. OK028]